MAFISVTRLRLRSIRFVPLFAWHAWQTLRQTRTAPGFLDGQLLPDKRRTFWTLTAWKAEEDMRSYMRSGAHLRAMPGLMHWCDEASVVHWTQPGDMLPSWNEADSRMRAQGRPSKVKRPTPEHAALAFAEPQTTRSAPIRPQTRP